MREQKVGHFQAVSFTPRDQFWVDEFELGMHLFSFVIMHVHIDSRRTFYIVLPSCT